MFTFLLKPYPFNSNPKNRWLTAILISCFASLFLIAFQPWGIALWTHPYKTVILFGYGIVCLVTIIIYGTVLKFTVDEDNWNIWKEILSILILISIIGLFNFIYSVIVDIADFNLSIMLFFIACTFLLGFFPIAVMVFLKHNRYLKINQREAQIIDEQINQINTDEKDDTSITFIAENGKDNIILCVNDILFIQSADNYSELVYLEAKHVKKTMFRSSLKKLGTQHDLPYLIRCHRSTIVNLKRVQHITGNAQGYKLSFFDTPDIIPVSRNFSTAILSGLKSLQKG